jgi:hypothetical protein
VGDERKFCLKDQMNTEQIEALFWGDTSLSSRVNQNFGKGNWFAARPRYVREVYGEAAFSSVSASLPEDARRYFLKPPLAFSWLPIQLLYQIDFAIVQGPMKGRVSLMEEFGAAIAVYDLNWLYQAFLKLSSPEFLLRQSGLICKTYMRETTIIPEVTPGAAQFSLTGAPLARYMCNYGIPGWTRSAIEAAGGRDVKVEHSSCLHDGSPGCCWSLRWV